MKELLAASTESGGQGSDAEEGLIDKKDISGEHKLESTGKHLFLNFISVDS